MMSGERNDWLYKGLIVVLFVIVGFVAHQMWDQIRRMEQRITRIEVRLAANYVTRETFTQRLERIEDELKTRQRP